MAKTAILEKLGKVSLKEVAFEQKPEEGIAQGYVGMEDFGFCFKWARKLLVGQQRNDQF